ncbi:hypothetical protein B0H11DRAFT_2291080 [Mycena galericulata]|nr:hypothetical protein B0H11DRAFT_2291080 [Mycena galericulata]
MSDWEIGCVCGVWGHQKSGTEAQPERTPAVGKIPISMSARSMITRGTDNHPRPRTRPYRSYHRSGPSILSESFDRGGYDRLDIIPRYHENSLRAALEGRWLDLANTCVIYPGKHARSARIASSKVANHLGKYSGKRRAINPHIRSSNSAAPDSTASWYATCSVPLDPLTGWMAPSGAKRTHSSYSVEREAPKKARLALESSLVDTPASVPPSLSPADWRAFPEIEEWAKVGENLGAHDASDADVVYMKMLDVFATPSAASKALGGQASSQSLK